MHHDSSFDDDFYDYPNFDDDFFDFDDDFNDDERFTDEEDALLSLTANTNEDIL